MANVAAMRAHASILSAGGLAAAISNGCTSLAMMTPMRTGKRGRPPGSTTGSAAKRVAAQAEQVVLLSRATIDMQKQLTDMRELLASVVETQTNQTAVIEYLQKALAAAQRASASSDVASAQDSADERSKASGDDSVDAHYSALMV
jgi:hypothetical protein